MDLTLDNVGKCYDGTWVLEGIDLTIGTGEFFSLLGASGSGKTTLLKAIAGIEIPDKGRILHGETNITSDPMENRPFNTVFQGYALFPHMNVFDNVAFGLRVKGISGHALKKSVHEMIERVGLTDRIQAFPAQLSGGQKQRVAIARVLVCKPEVILLDEPLSALDASLRGQMQRFLKELHRDLGLTFIFVTHDQDEAISLSDRICILNEGRIEQVDTSDALYHAPKTRFVAAFIGLNNFIPIDTSGQTEFGHVPQAGNSVLTIRPESVKLGPGDGLNAHVVLMDRRFHGDNTLLTFRTNSNLEILVRQPGRGDALELGEEATLHFPEEACVLVPKDSVP